MLEIDSFFHLWMIIKNVVYSFLVTLVIAGQEMTGDLLSSLAIELTNYRYTYWMVDGFLAISRFFYAIAWDHNDVAKSIIFFSLVSILMPAWLSTKHREAYERSLKGE